MKIKLQFTMFAVLSLSLLLFLSGCTDEDLLTNDNEIKLAALLPLSGELGSKGTIRKLAIEKGVEDANTNWKADGKNLHFSLKVEDSKSDPETALAKARELWEKGYRIFIAGSSAEVEKLQPWAKKQGAIVISYSSSSPNLGIEDDGVFRMVPDDTQQAKALASLLEYEGIYGIVPVYRNDIYGNELSKLLTTEFTSLHGTVSDPVTYEPQETNWNDITQKISTAVNSLKMEQNRIAVVLVAFDETIEILEQTKDIDSLRDIRWVGSDTVTLSPVILKDKEIAQKATQVNLSGVTFGIPDSALLRSIQTELKSLQDGNILPDALFAYDIPGMLAAAISGLEQPLTTKNLKNYMVEGSASYAGVTGWTLLNEKGDRKYYHYDIWEVRHDTSKNAYAWSKTAKYLNTPGTTAYISPVLPSESDSFLFGYEGQEYNSERALTRDEFTYMLMNATNRIPSAEKVPKLTYSDASAIDQRAKNAVAFAQKLGITGVYNDDTFKPNQEITWIEAIEMAVRAMNWPLVNSDGNERLDSIIPDTARPYIVTAMNQHLITLTEEEFANVMNNPVLLGDATLMMIELMKGNDSYVQVDS